MFVLVAIIQALSGLGLIFLVLLHSGKGGGLSDMFGGGIGAQTAGSTVVEQNLDRITVLTALIFAFTTIALASSSSSHQVLSALRGTVERPVDWPPFRIGPEVTSEWRNWQTRQLEGLVPARVWGFKSPLRHSSNP